MAMNLGSFASRVVATKVVATDGTGDFTDIQSAIDALPAGGGVVYVKEGTYTITASIMITSDNVAIIGAGRSTVITAPADVHVFNIGFSPALPDLHGILIQDLRTSGGNEGIGIRADESAIKGCWVDGATLRGIYWSSGGERSNISNNFVSDCSDDGIYTNGTGTAIIGNTSYSNDGIGIRLDGNQNRVIGNHVTDNEGHGIYLYTAHRNVISANYVADNDKSDTASYDGIALSTSNANVITNNRCRENDRYEISNDGDDNIIVGNNCKGTDHVGAINDTGANTELGHNKTT